MNINANETLQYLSNAGIINIEQVQKDVEIMKKNGENQTVSVLQMLNEDGEETDSCPHPGEKIRMKVDGVVCAGEIMRGIER